MPRTTVKPVMALLAGVAFIAAAAHAEAAPTTAPLVLDNAALDSVTAGNYGVFVMVYGQAAGAGDPVGRADVLYFSDAEGNETRGAGLGIVGALGFGLGAGSGAQSATYASVDGDLRYTRDFRKVLGGANGIAIDFSASIGWAASFGELQYPF